MFDPDDMMDEIYAAIDPDMEAGQVEKILTRIVDDYGIKDPFDLITIGIFLADVWRPGQVDEEDDSDDLDEDEE